MKKELTVTEIIMWFLISLAIIGFSCLLTFPLNLSGFNTPDQQLNVFEYAVSIGAPAGLFFSSIFIQIGLILLAIILSEIVFIMFRKTNKNSWDFLESLGIKFISVVIGSFAGFALLWIGYFSGSFIDLIFFAAFIVINYYWLILIPVVFSGWVLLNHVIQKKMYKGQKKKLKIGL